ncbi:MAG: TIGR04282 family arsenosugar biosynthesis glycosyltransferase [Anaerolineae bacterium]|nr:TIGR04282 family arsenosugar biosynthesis glycosyltransferase [Anaerolineae bacterium]
MRQHLIIYAKRPLAGYAKSRLGAAIGGEAAAGIYARLLYTYLLSLVAASLPETTLELSVADRQDCAYFDRAFPELIVRPQVEGDLGTRMNASFQQAFREGAEAVVLTGSDIPGMTIEIVRQAFALLRDPIENDRAPGVVGPAADGGYYLVGMRAPGANIFEGIAWSTEAVLTQTEALATAKGVRLARLPQLADIDLVEDYHAWLANLRNSIVT